MTEAILQRIEAVNPTVNAFITVIADEARAAAKHAERRVMTEPIESLGRLHGVPITVKDLTPTAGVRTTFGLVGQADNVPEEDGVTWARLKAEGPILLGKTSTPPLGVLCVTENDIIGITNNPWDPERSVGGSSGGAAAALAAGFGPLATGSDGGGSIRVPSSYCGTVGLKPSRGRVPLYSEGAIFETVDVVGPMTRTVEDAALMLSIMAGPHPWDPYSLPEWDVDYVAVARGAAVAGTRIAFCLEMGRGPIETDVADGVRAAAERFESELGAHVDFVEVPMPDFHDYFMAYWAPIFAWSMGDLEGFDANRYPPLAEWLEIGKKASLAGVLETAYNLRAEEHNAFARIFDEYDFLVTPTTPQTAYPHPDPRLLGPSHVAGVRVKLPACDNSRFTDPVSNCAYPAISILCGFSPTGLPIGMQIIGRHNRDDEVLRAAAAFERGFAPNAARPPLNGKATA